MKLQFVKLFVVSALVCNVLSEGVAADKKPSMWKKVKKALLSKPAKIAYGCVTAIVLLYHRKKQVDEKERARSLRNGKIVYSCLVEYTHEDLRGRFVDRYMPRAERDYWCMGRSYFYGVNIKEDNYGTNVIIRDNGIARDNSIALLHEICGDIDDMNAYAKSIEKSTCWTTVIERYELHRIEGMPLREDFDKPRYQLKIIIPNAGTV